jgi:2-oxoglutarate dehydrogenase E2 component (dihydrolipoamide succinyltransferase)
MIAKNDAYIKKDQEVLELETDKVNQVLYSPESGLLHVTASIDQTVSVGQVIGYVDTEGAKSAHEPVSAPSPAAPPLAAAPPASSTNPIRKPVDAFVQEIKTPPPIPPAAKTPIIEPKATTAGSASRKKMTGLRRTIAQRLVEVKNTTAMLTTFNEVDMSAIMEIRAKEKDVFFTKHGVKLGFMSFFVKAVASALKAYPQVNAYIDGEDIVTFSSYDIGVAVSTDRGLVVPVLKGCDSLSFGGVEKEIERFAKKAREATISVDDMRGGTFTITNGGVFGSLLSTPILNPPQSAILGMHSIVKRAVVINDQIVIRPMMYLALSYDHRIIDGKEAVLFLVHLKQSLEDPSKLLLDL